jgi:hypothetical protein
MIDINELEEYMTDLTAHVHITKEQGNAFDLLKEFIKNCQEK